MLKTVYLSRTAKKDLSSLPQHVVLKALAWVSAVERFGLEEVRKKLGYHDEPLKGKRTGQRSVRLSIAYRAIYRIEKEEVEFVLVEEVNKHDY